MSKKHLIRTSRLPYHVVNQVNNREWFQLELQSVWKIFANELYAISLICGAKIHSFVLMSNHYHLMVSTPQMDLGKVMEYFSRSVTKTYNSKSGRRGHLFNGRYRWSLIDTPLYYAHALKYVYRNPVEAGMCERVEDHPYSSLHGLTGQSPLLFPALTEAIEVYGGSYVPEDWERMMSWLNERYEDEDSEVIRKALRRKKFELPKVRSSREPSRLELGLV